MSLNIETKIDESTVISLAGRLDTTTAPILEEELDKVLSSAKNLIFDLEKLEYISSAGLRVILKAQKSIGRGGTLRLIHVNKSVKEVFDITGFSDFLTIEG